MEEMRANHLGCIIYPVNNGIFTISTGEGFLPSTVGFNKFTKNMIGGIETIYIYLLYLTS